MKRSKLFFAGLAVIVLIGFTQCKKGNNTAPVNQTNTTAVADEFQTPDYQAPDLTPITDPSVSDGINADFDITAATPGQQSAAGCNTRPGYDCLPCLLRDLRLDSTQKHEIRHFLADYRDCIQDHFQKIRAIHIATLKKYNDLRRQLFATYKNNRISKADLLTKLKDLRTRLINDLRTQELKMHVTAVLQCRHELLRKIASVLDTRQLVLFKRWVANHI